MKVHSPYWAKIEDMRAIKGGRMPYKSRVVGRPERKKSLCPVIATMQRERLNYDYVKQLRQ